MAYNLTNLYISQSYQQLLQVSASTVTDGTGSLVSTLYLNGDKVITQTAISAISATTGSIAALNTFTGSAVYRSGSFTGSFTGSFLGSIVSSSYAFTASSAVSSSRAITSSLSISSSYAFTASSAISSSYSYTASSAVSSSNSISSSYAYTASSAVSASYALTASYALNAGGGGTGAGFPFSGSAQITGSLGVTGSINATNITGSLFGTSSQAISASYATTTANANAATTAVYANNLGSIQVVTSGSTTSAQQNAVMFAGGGHIPTGLTTSPAITVTGLSGTLFYNVFVTATPSASAMPPGQAASVTVKSLVGNQLTFESNQAGPYGFSFIGMYLI